jgi:hypothetical protein
MAQASKSPKLTCGAIALIGALALTVVVALQRQAQPLSWASTGAAAIAVAGLFVVARGLWHFLWGLTAAAALTLHPYWQQLPDDTEDQVFIGAVLLALVACISVAWHLAFHPRFAWKVWPLVLVVLGVCTGVAWKANPHLGLLAMVLSAAGLLAAAFLAARLRRHDPPLLPSRLNLATAGLLIFAGPALGLVVYRFLDRPFSSTENLWQLVRDSFPDGLSISTAAIAGPYPETWCWPHLWAVVPLGALSLALTGARGWKQWRQRELPAAWFLVFLTLVVLAALFVMPADTGLALPLLLTALVVLLGVSLVGELLRRTWDRLVLLPPDARASEPEIKKRETAIAPVGAHQPNGV